MAWNITGTYYAPCSCKVGCPCIFGEMDGDQGWCSGTLAFDIRSGTIEGTDVAGTKAVLVADWPRGFLGGNGTGRIYFDPAVSQQQQSALETVLGGKRGGVFEAVAGLIPTVLPSKKAPINFQKNEDETRVTIGDVGELIVKPLRGPTGEATRVLHGAAAFRENIGLARGNGSYFKDPDMRSWESAGHAEQTDFDWNG